MFIPKRLLSVSVGVLFSSLISIPQLSKDLFIDFPNSLNSFASGQTVEGYVPPPRRISRTQRRDGSGSRGCSNSKAIATSLTLIVPSNHVPTTVSNHPTFLWYVSEVVSAPVKFTLIEQQSLKPVFKKQLKIQKAGIMQLQIPSRAPALVEGKQYRWTVALVCNERRPSENTYAYAWIERVPLDGELAQLLAGVTSRQERALILARAGIWYDAASTLYEISQRNSDKRVVFSAFDNFTKLLRQVGLSKLSQEVTQAIEREQQISTQTK